ncbi:MAG: SPOR domain-containing protein [Treponema sp.]|nr:SPOR domain-containing protein [Treponema sp.]
MKRFFMPFLACAVFALVPSVPGLAGVDYIEYLEGAVAELVPLDPAGVEPSHVWAPVRTVVPPSPNPDLPNNGVTWAPTGSPDESPAEAPAGQPLAATVYLPPGSQEVSIRLVVTINGEERVIEIPTGTVGQIVQALAPAAPVPTPVAPALGPVALTPAPAPAPVAQAAPRLRASGDPAVITPRMPAPDGPGVYRVQVGSFARTALARNSFDQLRSAGFQPAFEMFGSMYRVVIPGVPAAEMQEVARRLGSAGFGEAWARREN